MWPRRNNWYYLVGYAKHTSFQEFRHGRPRADNYLEPEAAQMLDLVNLRQRHYRCNSIDQAVYRSPRRDIHKERGAEWRWWSTHQSHLGSDVPGDAWAKSGTARYYCLLPRNKRLKQPPPSSSSSYSISASSLLKRATTSTASQGRKVSNLCDHELCSKLILSQVRSKITRKRPMSSPILKGCVSLLILKLSDCPGSALLANPRSSNSSFFSSISSFLRSSSSFRSFCFLSTSS